MQNRVSARSAHLESYANSKYPKHSIINKFWFALVVFYGISREVPKNHEIVYSWLFVAAYFCFCFRLRFFSSSLFQKLQIDNKLHKFWFLWRPIFLQFLEIHKGQLISKGLFKIFVCTKKRTKIFLFSALASKRGQIKKIKALYYIK